MFRRYGYEYEFRTSHVTDVFHVKNSRANLVIRELTAAGILESPHYGTYRFYSRKKLVEICRFNELLLVAETRLEPAASGL